MDQITHFVGLRIINQAERALNHNFLFISRKKSLKRS